MLRRAGPDNLIKENTFRDGGLWGVTNRGTNGTRIEGNKIYGHQGFTVEKPLVPWLSAAMIGPGYGIDVAGSSGVIVIDNMLYNNKTVDIYWDGLNDNTFSGNTCAGGEFCNNM